MSALAARRPDWQEVANKYNLPRVNNSYCRGECSRRNGKSPRLRILARYRRVRNVVGEKKALEPEARAPAESVLHDISTLVLAFSAGESNGFRLRAFMGCRAMPGCDYGLQTTDPLDGRRVRAEWRR
jgi:hypothetical protein